MNTSIVRELICQNGAVRAYVDGHRRIATARRKRGTWVIGFANGSTTVLDELDDLRCAVRRFCTGGAVVFEPHTIVPRHRQHQRSHRSVA